MKAKGYEKSKSILCDWKLRGFVQAKKYQQQIRIKTFLFYSGKSPEEEKKTKITLFKRYSSYPKLSK